MVEGRTFVINAEWGTSRGTISEDGEKITEVFSPSPSHPSYPKGSTSAYTRVRNPGWPIMRGR
jgi:hypothetical protein